MNEPSVFQWSKTTFCEHWKKIIFVLTISIFLSLAQGAFPIVWQTLIDQAINGGVRTATMALFLFIFLIRTIPFAYATQQQFLNRYELNMRLRLFKHVLSLSVPFHKDKDSTTVLLEANKGLGAATSLLRMFMQGDIITEIPLSLFAFWYIGTHSLTALTILLVFLCMFLTISYLLGKKIAKVEEEYNKLDNEVSTREREVVQQIETIKLHRSESYEEEWLRNAATNALKLENRKIRYDTWFQVVSSLAHALPFCIALIVFLPEVTKGTLTVGTLIALQIYSNMAVGPIGYVASMFQEIKSSAARLKPALRLLEQKPTITESSTPVEMNPLRHEICLKDVHFKYPGAEKEILQGVSLTISAGEKVAIVGRTGSGKSTLARLLVRFFDPNHGLITMDGTDVRQLSFDSLYQQISYVTQEVPIFSGTIGDNVRHGLVAINDDRVIDACSKASADFVLTQKHGLETEVGELGEKLSGGERQRLALARIFLRHPSLLILDEATAPLDTITEGEVQLAFDQMLQMNGGTTMVVIAHRITTVKNADRIVVMEEGRINDSGTHEELLSRCSLYQELCQGMTK